MKKIYPGKSSAKSPGLPLERQAHGGALRRGGAPGNPGGGRPPDELRRYSRAVYGRVLDELARRLSEVERLRDRLGDTPPEEWTTAERQSLLSVDDVAKIGAITARVGIPAQTEARVEATVSTLTEAERLARVAQLLGSGE